MPKKTDPEPLHPIDEELTPLRVGETVAFREDHDVHGMQFDNDDEVSERAKYGVITAIGLQPDGTLAFDLNVYDPFHGVDPEADTVTYRATMGEIQ